MSDLRNKVQGINPDLKARDVHEFSRKADNVYEAINIMSKRARLLASDLKIELNSKLEDFAVTSDRIEEILENKEQIEISKFYERLPSPSLIATDEFLNDQLEFRYRDMGNRDEDSQESR